MGLPSWAARPAMSLFQAYGRVRFALGMTLLRNGVLLVPALALTTAALGARGIAAGQLLSDISSGVIAGGFLVAQLRVLARRAALPDSKGPDR